MMSTPTIRIWRSRRFSAAVRYRDEHLSDSDNSELYGRLACMKGVGREFRLEVAFEGPVDPRTGMIVNLTDIDRWLDALISPLDHRLLNELEEIFRGVTPTTERLALYLRNELVRLISSESSVRLSGLRLHEDETLSIAVLS